MTVAAGSLASVAFDVTCMATGAIRFGASSTGVDTDVDGFLIKLDQRTDSTRVPANATLTLTHVPVGHHTFSFGDVQPNCVLTSAASGSFEVSAGDTVTVNAAASCAAIPEGTVAFTASDPQGDTLPNTSTGVPRAHDVLGVTGRYAGAWMMLTVRLTRPAVPSSGSPLAALISVIDLDVDENLATGTTPLARVAGSNAQQGVDYTIGLFDSDSASTGLYRQAGIGDRIGRVPARFAGDSVVVLIPLAKIGADDGNMTMTVLVGTRDRPTDYAPNNGIIAARRGSVAP